MNFRDYFEELKRRNVFKAALAYVVIGWIILQVIAIVFPMLNIPGFISKAVLVILLVGFPVWLVFAWVYEVTSEGLKKTKKVNRQESITAETSNKFNKIIIGALGIAIILLGANLYSNYSGSNVSEIPAKQGGDLKTSVSAKEDKSVAVLAFADMSPEKDQEYFSDGISEEILNYLARNPELTVISRTSSFSFKGKDTDIRVIGEKLNANYVLEGSVRKADSTLRVTAQLIHSEDGAHLWSETYDRKMNDIFKIQDEIAEAVTKNLEASLLGKEISEVDTEAYNKYLQAKYLRNQFTRESLENADRLINESIAIDSTYAPAWLLLGKIKASREEHFFSDLQEARALKYKAIEKAISIDPEFAEAYAFAGKIALRGISFKKAENNFKKALELAPQNPDVLYYVVGLPTLPIQERIRIIKKCIELDPLDYINFYVLSLLYFLDGQFEKALKAQEKYMVYYPNSIGDYAGKAEFLAHLGKEREALEALEKEQDEFLKAYGQAMVTMILYPGEKADEAIETFKVKYGSQDPYMVAQMYAWQNKKDLAFKWLGKAYEIRSANFIQLTDDPYMKNLKVDRRWEEFLEKIGFPEESSLEIDLD